MASRPRASGTNTRGSRRRGFSWSQSLLVVAIGGPALAIGGVPPVVVPVFLLVVAALWGRLCTRGSGAIEVPRAALIGMAAVGLTAIQLLPLPSGLRHWLSPEVATEVTAALVGTGADAWPTLSVTPADTGLEVARLIGLLLLFVASAQLSWRITAVAVAATGTLVAGVGFVHELIGTNAIYGLYEAKYTALSTESRRHLGTFVNPNHQGGFLLLSVFSTAALAVDWAARAAGSRDLERRRRDLDLTYAAVGATVIQAFALVLTLSRGALGSLVIVAPLAILAWFRTRVGASDQSRHRGTRGLVPRALLLVAMGAAVWLVMQHAALPELRSLWSLTDAQAEMDPKLGTIRESFALVPFAPVFGIGRGAHIDLFALVHSNPTRTLVTHLESVPVAMIVEWGPVGGGIIALALGGWWGHALLHRRKRSSPARTIALLGLLALAIQSVVDFGLQFLGVAAPACALAGALSPTRSMTWDRRRSMALGLASLALMFGIAVASIPGSWSQRPERNADVVAGRIDPIDALALRPLDGRLHLLLARDAAARGQWSRALERSEVATRLAPGVADGWLIRAAAERSFGNIQPAIEYTRQGLMKLVHRPDPELVEYILALHPRPDDLAAVAPTNEPSWQLLANVLMERAPAHADAIAAARQDAAPADPKPLQLRVRYALHAGMPALALHHARLWRALEPDQAAPHLAVVRALSAFRPPRLDDAIEGLEAAIEGSAIKDGSELGDLEQQLATRLIRRGSPTDLNRAAQLLQRLRSRPANGRQRRQRRKLRERLESRVLGQ